MMIVVIPTSGEDLSGMIEQRFARSPRYVVYDTKTHKHRVIVNPASRQAGGAGVTASQMVLDQGAEVVIAGEMGPRAFDVLERAGVKVYARVTGSIKDALEMLEDGTLEFTSEPTGPALHDKWG